MRPWDNFFWYLELDDLPTKSIVLPVSWPPTRGNRAMDSSFRVANNRISLSTGAGTSTIWLSPEIVDLQQRVTVAVKSKDYRFDITPEVETLLEDARTRADRQHAFWARVQVVTGRGQ